MPSRRESMRQATRREILSAARKLLADGGPGSVSLRAVATEIGMSAPGIYRYFPSHEDLILALTDEIVGELVDAVRAGADAQPADDAAARLFTATRTFRTWCIGHQREFQLAFGLTPAPPGTALPPHCDTDNVRALCGAFFELVVELWRSHRFPVEPEESITPALAEQLRAFVDGRGEDVPLGLVKTYLDGWVRLYGMVAMEIYGHLRFILTDTDALFETMLSEYVAGLLGDQAPAD